MKAPTGNAMVGISGNYRWGERRPLKELRDELIRSER